jgi:hypothetical protein
MTNAVITAQIGSSQTDYGFKNRVINGDFRINQRAGTALQTGVTGGASYWLADRFRIGGSALATGRFSFQTVADAPAGFVNSGKITVTTAQTPAASDIQVLTQIIEGINVSDFMWGTSSAIAVSLSFWVKANLSGQYVVAIRADSNTATYLATYTISSANVWQYVTISIPGPTFGTWGGLTLSTTTGIRLDFNLGTGTSSINASTNTWLTSDFFRTTADVQLIQTLGATWQITGVQLETGSLATGFDYRFYNDELLKCYRYFFQSKGFGTTLSYTDAWIHKYEAYSKPAAYWQWVEKSFPVPMRGTPTVSVSDGAGTIGRWSAWTSQGGGITNGYTPYTVYCNNNINMTVSDYNNSGTFGYWCAVRADSEL